MDDYELEEGELLESEDEANVTSKVPPDTSPNTTYKDYKARTVEQYEDSSDEDFCEQSDLITADSKDELEADGEQGDEKSSFNGADSYEKIQKDGNLYFISVSSTRALPLKKVLQYLKDKSFVSSCLPEKLNRESPGSIFYLVDKKCFGSYKDVGFDCLSPWSQSKSSKGKKEIKPKWDTDIKVEGNLTFRRCRVFNPRNTSISRRVSYLLDDFKNLASPVLYQYIINDGNGPIPYADTKGKRTTPSRMEAVRTALSYRTTTMAQKELNERGINVGKKTIYNAASSVSSCSKQRAGKKKATDPAKVLAMACRNPNISFRICGTQAINAKNGNEADPDLEIIEIFPNGIAALMMACPNQDSRVSHTADMAVFDTLDEDGKADFLESLRANRTVSQTIPGMGCQVQVDTTFGLSHLLVTTAVAVLDNVVDRKSGKNKLILLGVMLHQNKKAEHHEEFGKRLSAEMLKISKNRRIPSFLADGEIALQQIAKGLPFEGTTRLICDIHTKANLKTKFKKDGERLAQLLFGKKKEVDGVTTYYRGAFGALCRKEYEEMLTEDLHNEPELLDWLSRQDYYATHSLRSKLEAGWFLQWMTTNALEGFNNQFKVDNKSRLPGEELLGYFQRIHKAQMEELFGAYVGGESPCRLADHVKDRFRTVAEWETMSDEAKSSFLKKVGLEPHTDECSDLRSVLPSWITEGPQSLTLRLLKEVKKQEVIRTENDYIVKEMNRVDGMAVVKFDTDDHNIACHRLDCKNKPTKKPCCHVLAVLLTWDTKEAQQYFEELEKKYFSCSSKQIVRAAMRPSDGGKFDRKGSDKSRGNEARKIDVVARPTVFQVKQTELRSPAAKKSRDDSEGQNLAIRSRRDRGISARKLFTPTRPSD